MFEQVSCYHCGSEESELVFETPDRLTGNPGLFTYVRCDHCGLIRLDPRVAREDLGDYDDGERGEWALEPSGKAGQKALDMALTQRARDRDRLVRSHARRADGGAILDVGCGPGEFLVRQRDKRGRVVTGVDMKDYSAPMRELGIPFVHGAIYDHDWGEATFDVITMWHSLARDYDPRRALCTARDLLAPGGRIVVEVPRFGSASQKVMRSRWPGLRAPLHTVMFEKRTLTAMVSAAGLDVVDYLPFGATRAAHYWLGGVAAAATRGRGLESSNWAIPYAAASALARPWAPLARRLNVATQTIICG
jgi:SAM-dependent methyltransferase